jgi:hypothetical protein
MADLFRVPELGQFQDPGMMGQAANALSSRIINPDIRELNAYLGRSQEQGIIPALGRSLERAPMDVIQGLANLPGVQPLVQALFTGTGSAKEEPKAQPQGEGQDTSIWQALGDISRATGPQQEPQQAQQTAFTPYQPIGVPELPAYRGGSAADFSAAREALGPARSAQKLGKSERMGRTLGAGAAGGLRAAQNVTGRQAGLGEILAGIAAGTGGEVATMNAENRQFEEIAAQSAELRNRQLSSIAMTEEATRANKSQVEAQEYNRRGLMKLNLEMQVAMANASNSGLLALGEGTFADRATGQIVRTHQETAAEAFTAINAFVDATKKDNELTGTVLSQQVMMENVERERRPAFMAAFLALQEPATRNEFIAHMKTGDEQSQQLATRLEQVSSGNWAGDDAVSQNVLANATAYLAGQIEMDIAAPPGADLIYSWSLPMYQKGGNIYDPSRLGLYFGDAYRGLDVSQALR